MKTFKILMIQAVLGMIMPAHSASLEIPELAVVSAGWKMAKVEDGIDEFHVMAAFGDALDRKTFRLVVNGVDFTPFLQPAGENLSMFSLPMPVQALEITIEGDPKPDSAMTAGQRSASITLRELVDVSRGMSVSLPAVRGDRRNVPAGVRAKLPPRDASGASDGSP